MKRKNNVFRMLVSGILAASLLAGPAQAAGPEIRVSSCKGSTLVVGERSGLIIGPSGAEYTASSSAPETVAVEKVLTFWVAVAKAPGTATISVKNGTGGTGSLTLTVGSAATAATEAVRDNGSDLSINMDIRLKMVEYINQTRREHGLAELPIDESLMNAAQDVSSHADHLHRGSAGHFSFRTVLLRSGQRDDHPRGRCSPQRRVHRPDRADQNGQSI